MKTKNIFKLIFIIFFFAVSFTSITFAQENPNEMVKKYSIQFPITELGNCTSFTSCKSYCDNEANRNACMSFAKKKGFYKEDERRNKNPEIIKDAQSELGCNSESSCRSICEKEENIEKCSTFAKKHNLSGGRERDPGDQEILQKAKTILGCDSENSCRSICEDLANQEKCSEFAKQTGLGGGISRVGPGGCNSEESCRVYCESHMDECRKFGGDNNNRQPPPEASRRGPGGCNSEESCRAYCQNNPQECEKFGGRGPEQQDMEKLCKENPDKCADGRVGPISPDDYCKRNPERCKPPSEANREFINGPSKERTIPYENREQESRPIEAQTPSTQNYQENPIENTFREQRSEVNTEQIRLEEPSSTTQQSVRGVSAEISLWQKILNFFYND